MSRRTLQSVFEVTSCEYPIPCFSFPLHSVRWC
jgi:hypothetical protein